MRIAIVSTPRSGNMWLRRLLVAAYGLEERSAHAPGEVDWSALPEQCVLQLHWRRSPAFHALLRRYGFSVAVLARHPLDVLVSILHFAPHEPQTARWLDREGGDESELVGADPTSASFLTYATGPRASALLSVTPEWWRIADARARYEDLVAAPAAELERVVHQLGVPPLVPVEQAAVAVRFVDLRREATNEHFWQGRPGLWRHLLPVDVARAIAAAQPAVAALGYEVDPGDVTPELSRERWSEL